MSTNKHKEKSRQKTHSMLCKNSPLGRLNFLMLSADADAKQFLKNKSDKCFFSKSMILQTIAVLFRKNYIFICMRERERERGMHILCRMLCHCSHWLFMVCESWHRFSCKVITDKWKVENRKQKNHPIINKKTKIAILKLWYSNRNQSSKRKLITKSEVPELDGCIMGASNNLWILKIWET